MIEQPFSTMALELRIRDLEAENKHLTERKDILLELNKDQARQLANLDAKVEARGKAIRWLAGDTEWYTKSEDYEDHRNTIEQCLEEG